MDISKLKSNKSCCFLLCLSDVCIIVFYCLFIVTDIRCNTCIYYCNSFFPSHWGMQREPGNLMLRHSVSIKTLRFSTSHCIPEALRIKWNSMPQRRNRCYNMLLLFCIYFIRINFLRRDRTTSKNKCIGNKDLFPINAYLEYFCIKSKNFCNFHNNWRKS